MTGGGLCSILIGGVSPVPLPIPDFSPPVRWLGAGAASCHAWDWVAPCHLTSGWSCILPSSSSRHRSSHSGTGILYLLLILFGIGRGRRLLMGSFRNPPGSLAPLRLQLCPASTCPANSKDRPGLLSCPDASPTLGVACASSGSSVKRHLHGITQECKASWWCRGGGQ